jgi:hypothetical protein
MSEPIVTTLYGNYHNGLGRVENGGIVHPWREDIYRNPHEYQQGFEEMGVRFQVAIATEAPSGQREIGDTPEVTIFSDLVYDDSGKLVSGRFAEGDLAESDAVIDHWVTNFHGETSRYPDLDSREAFGLGLPLERTWNPYPVQNMGNRKDRMEEVVAAREAGIPTFAAHELEAFAATVPDGPVMYKPLAGARGKGIEIFNNRREVQRALSNGEIHPEGLIQPYLDLTTPIPGLKAAEGDAEAALLLQEFNSSEGKPRQREVRMHAIAYRDESGELHAEAYPTLKYGQPNKRFLQVAGNVALDPKCIGVGHPVHDVSVQLAKDVVAAASKHSGLEVPHYYGTFDWMYDGASDRMFVGDGNSRGPAIAEEARAARASYIRRVGESALRNWRISA